MKKALVRHVTDMEGLEFIGSIFTVKDEEYGTFVYLYNDGNDPVALVCELSEDDGSIEEIDLLDESAVESKILEWHDRCWVRHDPMTGEQIVDELNIQRIQDIESTFRNLAKAE